MRKARRGSCVMPEEDASSPCSGSLRSGFRSSDIRVEDRDMLIRLRDMIEDDLAEPEPSPPPISDHRLRSEPE